ncbi:MAG: zinc ribbon domain-containing protein [bacterium]
MPIYEYRCKKCHETMEVFQKTGEDCSGLKCEKCGEPELERIISLFSSTNSGASTATTDCASQSGFS